MKEPNWRSALLTWVTVTPNKKATIITTASPAGHFQEQTPLLQGIQAFLHRKYHE